MPAKHRETLEQHAHTHTQTDSRTHIHLHTHRCTHFSKQTAAQSLLQCDQTTENIKNQLPAESVWVTGSFSVVHCKGSFSPCVNLITEHHTDKWVKSGAGRPGNALWHKKWRLRLNQDRSWNISCTRRTKADADISPLFFHWSEETCPRVSLHCYDLSEQDRMWRPYNPRPEQVKLKTAKDIRHCQDL